LTTGPLLSLQSLLNENPLHNEPGFENEIGERCTKYNQILTYENFNIAIINYIKNPGSFDIFLPQMREQFIQNYDKIMKNLEKNKIKNQKINSPVYNFNTNSLFKNIIEEIQVYDAETKYRITKIGIFDIPENIFPNSKYLVRGHIVFWQRNKSQFNAFLDFPMHYIYNSFESLQQSYFSQNHVKLHHFLKTLMNQDQEPFDIKSIGEDSEMEGVYNIHVFGETTSRPYDILFLPLCVLIEKFQFEFHIMATTKEYTQEPLINGMYQENVKNGTWVSVKKIDKNDDRWTLCRTNYDNDTPIQRRIGNNARQNAIRYYSNYDKYNKGKNKGFILKICFDEPQRKMFFQK
jgi:hypothetical protein